MRSSSILLPALALLLLGYPGRRAIAQTPGPIIDTIVVVNHNIFDERDIETPSFLTRAANALHVRTSARVIRRALLLNQGEPYDSARAIESERALRSLNVFRQVQIDTIHLGSRLALRVQTADGWSSKPQFNYSTSGGSVTWQVGMEEENLLGTATSLTALYSKTPDRSSGRFLYVNPHFIGRRPRLSLTYQPLSDGRRGSWALAIPFYQTAARYQVGTSGDAGTYRVLVFRDHALVDSTQRHSLRLSLSGGRALRATSRSYLRLWGTVAWRREDFAPESTTVVPRSTFGTVGFGIEAARTRYHVLQRFNTYARREDVNLSQFLRLGLWVAPRAFGYPAGGAGVAPEIGVQLGAHWPGGFVVMRGNAHGLLDGNGLDSARARGGVTLASQNFAAQTLIFHLEGGASRRVTPNSYYDTWLDQSGPRLYPAHAFTGTRTMWAAFEDRILLADDAMGLWGAGIAPFFDWGGAWFEDEPMRTGSDVGLALRLGPTRAVRGEVTEFAVGYRFGAEFTPDGWALSIRRGIAF
jgi:hypothetical protein